MIGWRLQDVPLTCYMLFLVVWHKGRKATTDRVIDRVTDIKKVMGIGNVARECGQCGLRRFSLFRGAIYS